MPRLYSDPSPDGVPNRSIAPRLRRNSTFFLGGVSSYEFTQVDSSGNAWVIGDDM